MSEGVVIVGLVSALGVVGGVLIIVAALRHRTRVVEMAHRERLAMIERGIAPAADTGGPAEGRSQRSARANRLLSAGIVTVGLGLGLATLIGFASGATDVAIGLGGSIAVVGGALVVTALVVHRPAATETGRSTPPV